MKKLLGSIFIWMLFSQFTWACSGDCLSCHPSLTKNILKDARHKPMLTCITCHKNVSTGISECGKDCFACHNINKVTKSVKEHDVIIKCKNCHLKMPKNFNIAPKQNNSEKSMYDLLMPAK